MAAGPALECEDRIPVRRFGYRHSTGGEQSRRAGFLYRNAFNFQRSLPRQLQRRSAWLELSLLIEAMGLAATDDIVNSTDLITASATTSAAWRCPLLAQSGHPSCARQCPLLGVKRTLAGSLAIIDAIGC
jgi:hypothetical protein